MRSRIMALMTRALGAAALLAVAASACAAQLTSTERAMGLAARPDWTKQRCNLPTAKSRVRICHVRGKMFATFEVEWRTGEPKFAQRLAWMADSVRWERFQDSTSRAMRAIATLVRCPKPIDTIGVRRPPQAINRREVWMVKGEARWVAVESRWELAGPSRGAGGRDARPVPSFRASEPGSVLITTEAGVNDGCGAIIEVSGVSI